VTAARDCARALLAHRRQAGALAVYDLSRGWAASEDGTLVRLAQHERNAGYVIVQEVMIAANAAIAAWAVERDCPILYRAHRAALATPPRAELLADLDALSSDDGAERFSAVQENLATVLRRATYEAYLYPHFGLCLPAYTHATSPLRRFPDLATQRNLLAVADGTAPVYTHGELGQAAEAINRLDADRRDARNEREKRKAHDQSRRELDHGGLEKLGDDGFFRAIKLAAGEDRLPGGLQAEIHRRLQEGLLGPREAHRLLAAAGDSWAPVRKDVLARLASEPEHAISVVSQHGQHVGESPEWTTEPVGTAAAPRFATTVTLSGVTSATRTGPAKREARGQAAVSLLARIAGGDDISTNIEDPDTPAATTKQRARVVVDPDRNPVSQLNEAAQRGLVTDLDWDVQHEGPPHAPLFTATVSAACGDGTPVSATGQGGAKTTARNAAALALLGTLATACEPPDRIPGAEPSQHPQDSQQQGGDAR
jgi:ribonuclease R